MGINPQYTTTHQRGYMKQDGEYTIYGEQDLQEFDYDYTCSFTQYTKDAISAEKQEKLIWGLQLPER